MKIDKTLCIVILLSILSTSCSQTGAVELATATIAPTETTAPTPTQEIVTVEALYDQYFAGEKIDVSKLSEEEWVELSIKLAEKKNADRGVNVLVYDYGQEKPTFIDPNQDNMMVEYDGVPSLDKTIEMFVPIAGKDEQGNLQFEVDGQLVTIGASAGVDWDMRVTEYGDPRIDWPIEEASSKGIKNLERFLEDIDPSRKSIFIPAILLNENLGQLKVSGVPVLKQALNLLIPEVDVNGYPLYARKIIVVGGPGFSLYEEGSNLNIRTRDMVEIKPGDNFFKVLNKDWTYYLGFKLDQDWVYGVLNKHYLVYYQGLISAGDSTPVLLGEKNNDHDMLSLASSVIIKAKIK